MQQKHDSSERDPLEIKVIGGSDLRVDSCGKVTGQTRYVEDILEPMMRYAAVLRSPHHHARLLGIDIAPAVQFPGVERILTAADIPGLNGLDGYSRFEPVLTPVGETMKHKGAPIALVVARTLEQARQAAEAIELKCQVLPHFFDVEEALKPDAVQLYPNGNVLSEFILAHGEIQDALEASDLVVETQYRTALQEHSALEREAALGFIDEEGHVAVIAATHQPHWQQGFIAQTLGIDRSQVRVIVPPTGGSFGGRQDPWPLVAAGLMAFLLRLPVRLTYSRREVFDSTPKRHPYLVQLKIGARRDGRLTGIQARIRANTGGYDSAGFWIPNYAVTAVGGAYSWQAVDAIGQTIFTNAPKCGQFRGYGTPQSVFALECTLDELCQQLALDPLDFRLLNCLEQGERSFLGYPVGESLGYRDVLRAIKPRFDQLESEARAFNADPENSELRMGVGLAGMWYRFGKSGSLKIQTQAELALDGHFIFYFSAPDYGQGIATVMAQLAAETLGVERDVVELINADTARVPDSDVQGASRATYFIGGSLCRSAENLKTQLLAVASELFDCHPSQVSLDTQGAFTQNEPTRRISFREIAQEFERLGKSRKVTGVFDLTGQFPDGARPEYVPLFVTGAQIAQVVVDLLTGQVEVKRIVAAHDVGRAINPADAHGQIVGGIMMGIGTALVEEYLPGLTTGFSDYILPLIDSLPEFEVHLIEVPSYYGPFGAKGLGEAAILPTAPAVINAISRAIGVRLRRLPASPPRVLEAILQRSL